MTYFTHDTKGTYIRMFCYVYYNAIIMTYFTHDTKSAYFLASLLIHVHCICNGEWNCHTSTYDSVGIHQTVPSNFSRTG